MRKVLTYILIIVLSVGCKSKPDSESNFEKNLPKEDLVILNEMVRKFNELIVNKFDGDVGKFLEKIADGEAIFEDVDSVSNCTLIREFEKSTLEYKSKKMQYDTVFSSNNFSWGLGDEESYSEEPVIMTITQEGDTSWQDIMIPGEQTIENKIEYVRNNGYWNHLSSSSFIKALNETELDKMAITEYVDAKLAVGELGHILMAKTTLENNIDTDNYFIRRILIFEVYRNQMKKEHGC